MDKKVMYALIGGIAVVGAAVAYHMVKSQEDAESEDIE